MVDSNKEMENPFDSRLEEVISPGLTAKELVEKIVRAVLETEFGPTFTRTRGFDKMLNTIADTIVANPDLRRQSLSVASTYIGRKIQVSKEQKGPNGKKE
jgi:hypothetical protein